MKIKTDYIKIGEKYDDSHGNNIPILKRQVWVNADEFKPLIKELEYIFDNQRCYLPSRCLDRIEQIIEELKYDYENELKQIMEEARKENYELFS